MGTLGLKMWADWTDRFKNNIIIKHAKKKLKEEWNKMKIDHKKGLIYHLAEGSQYIYRTSAKHIVLTIRNVVEHQVRLYHLVFRLVRCKKALIMETSRRTCMQEGQIGWQHVVLSKWCTKHMYSLLKQACLWELTSWKLGHDRFSKQRLRHQMKVKSKARSEPSTISYNKLRKRCYK